MIADTSDRSIEAQPLIDKILSHLKKKGSLPSIPNIAAVRWKNSNARFRVGKNLIIGVQRGIRVGFKALTPQKSS